MTVPTPENARKWLKIMTAEPHVAGTQADYRTAVFVRDRLQEWGWKVDLVSYEVLLNYPIGKTSPTGKTSLQINRPMFKELELDEAPLPTDKDSASSNAFGAFHGYGTSGKASGQVVYINYARPEDFTALEKLGITVKDKVVLARYGGNFRGLKVLNAQKHGARGILIYSDPGDDGYAKGDVYPAGPYRPGSAIQRGSVQFLSHGPGDPSTPRGPSVKNADRLPVDSRFGFPLGFAGDDPMFQPGQISVKDWEAKTGLKRQDYFATIPSLPISYNTAREIFQVLAGPNVPSGWQGGLPLAYHVGPGPAEVEFSITMDYQLRTIWNVIATIPGSVEPDRWIMVGNHRDAWVYGAVDPGSGTAATLEMCRAIGEAVKNGWKPHRTLVYASWDAEEYGLVGSTEWAEEHASTVDQNVALLLNVDSAVSGRELDMGGVPSLRDLALNAAGAINDVRTGRSLRELWIDAKRTAWAAASPLNLSDPIWDNAAHGSLSDGKKLRRRGFTAQDAPPWLGLGLHGVSRSPRDPRPRPWLFGQLRRVPLHLRRLHLDGEVRRSRVPDPHDGRPPVHSPDHAGRRGRGAAVALCPLWRGPPRPCRRAAPDPRQADSGQARYARASGTAIAGRGRDLGRLLGPGPCRAHIPVKGGGAGHGSRWSGGPRRGFTPSTRADQ